MLEIKSATITLNEKEVLELERIVTDSDEKESLRFIKKSIYDRIVHAQQGKLKSHLDTGINPVEGFIKNDK